MPYSTYQRLFSSECRLGGPSSDYVELKQVIVKVKHFLFSLCAAAFLTSAISVDSNLEVGSNAPKIEMIDGTNVVNDANSNGKIKVINFWNPKNPTSRIANRNLYQKYNSSDEDVQFISICTDSDDNLMNEVMKIDGVKTDFNFTSSEIDPRVFKDYNVEKNPRTFIISSQGKILQII